MKFLYALLGLAALYLAIIALLYFRQTSLIYPAGKVDMPDQAPAPFTNFDVTSSDGNALRGWYAPAKPNMPTIVYFHGNADNVPLSVKYHDLLLPHGFGVLLTSYRGYANNKGTPSEAGLYADASAFINALIKSGVPQKDIIIYGASLGSGVATEMAVRYPPKALVLACPFSTIGDAGAERYPFIPVKWLMHDKYDNLHKISQISAPILIANGRNDQVFSWKEGAKLAAAADPKLVTFKQFDGGHISFFFDGGGDQFIADWLNQFAIK